VKVEVPFCGPAYEARSKNISHQQCVNWYPARNQEGAVSPVSLINTPGLSDLFDLGFGAEVRGCIVAGAYLYAVADRTFFQIDTDYAVTNRGALDANTGNRISMAYNGSQVIMVDGAEGYTFTVSTNTFAKISDTDFPVADQVVFLDSYFIVNSNSTGQFFLSARNDGTSWAALDYATAERSPDNLVGLAVANRELWLIGEYSAEPWFNAGTSFPFLPVSNAFSEIGTNAPFSIAEADNSVIWLAQTKKGNAFVVRTQGYSPIKISTPAIDYQLSTYGTLSDAFAYTYMDDGHTFYVLTFPTEEKTWVYDLSTGWWHERRSSRNTGSGVTEGRHRANCHAFFNNVHCVGDMVSGHFYEMSLETYSDDGTPIKRIRSGPAYTGNQEMLFFSDFQVLFEAGVGLTSGQGSNPQVAIDWSDDGGHTWSNEIFVGIGKIGEYGIRAIVRRLGRARNRSFRVTISDPVKPIIIGAYATARAGV